MIILISTLGQPTVSGKADEVGWLTTR